MAATATMPAITDIVVRAKSNDTVIILPPAAGVARVEQPGPRGGREIYNCAPQVLGRLLARMDTDTNDGETHTWIDLLSVSTPGVAISTKRGETSVILAYGPRLKTVNQNRGGRVRHLAYNLPPTVWLQRYNSEGRLTHSYLWITPTKVASASDQVNAHPSPFGNVFAPAGNLCWGNVVTSPLRPHDPTACDNLFWGTDFNDHLVLYNHFRPAAGQAPYDSFTRWTEAMEAASTGGAAPELIWEGGHSFSSVLRRAMGNAHET